MELKESLLHQSPNHWSMTSMEIWQVELLATAQFTTQSKYYAINTIWFREVIFKRDVQLHKINTVKQLSDIFTKGLTRFVFEYLRKKIMGW